MQASIRAQLADERQILAAAQAAYEYATSLWDVAAADRAAEEVRESEKKIEKLLRLQKQEQQ